LAKECRKTAQDLKKISDNRLINLDILRGVAALAVCFYHFRRDGMDGTLYHNVAAYGVYGVDMFFVISGFVIPLSLFRMGFNYHMLVQFWISRFFRLYPAYALASVIGLGLWFFSTLLPGFRGAEPPPVTLEQILANAGLLCDWTGEKWFLIVAWSLAIEAQYYLVIALMCPLIFHRNKQIRILVLCCWVLCPLLPSNLTILLYWMALFGMGLSVMLFQQNLLPRWGLISVMLLCFGIQWVARDSASACAGLGTALVILLAPNLTIPRLAWVGGISYSLYLLHVPIGGRVMNFFERYPENWLADVLSVPFALATSILAAFIFFKIVEWPSHQLARRMKGIQNAKRKN
jgi:peptidoglycan/LPS O-acetylase OafA/YrhL